MTEPSIWSAAELKTRREATGASVRDMMRLLGLSSESNYQRYEAGRQPVPAFAQAEVERLEQWLDVSVETVLDGARDLVRQYGQPQTVDLLRWRKSADYDRDEPERAASIPFGVHARSIARAREALLDEDFEVRLVYVDEEAS